MGKIVLVNDVHSDIDDAGLLVGNRDVDPSEKGVSDSSVVSRFLVSKFKAKNVVASNANRVKNIIHHLRVDMRGATFRLTDALRERDFGVFTGTSPRFESEIFTENRICPEGGESVSQCRSRVMGVINYYDEHFPEDMNIFISHPFSCQIIANALENKPLSHMSDFWFKKGSIAIFETNPFFKFLESCTVL